MTSSGGLLRRITVDWIGNDSTVRGKILVLLVQKVGGVRLDKTQISFTDRGGGLIMVVICKANVCDVEGLDIYCLLLAKIEQIQQHLFLLCSPLTF